MINITTDGTESTTNCWYAMKSIHFSVTQQVFLNYNGSCDLGQDLVGHYLLRFGLEDTTGFFVAIEEDSMHSAVAEASEQTCSSGKNATCRYEVIGEHLTFRRCRDEVRSRVELQTCNGNRTEGGGSANFVQNDSSSSLLLDLSPRCNVNFTLSCFTPGVTKEVARLTAVVISVSKDTSSPSFSSFSWAVLVASVLTSTAIAVACLAKGKYAKSSVAQR